MSKSIKKNKKPVVRKFPALELAKIMNIHPFYVNQIAAREDKEKNFLTTEDELLRLYKKYFEGGK